MTWRKVCIGDLGRVVTGDTPPKKNPEYYGSAYPFIKPTDMRVGERFTRAYEECYSEEAYEKYSHKLIPTGATAVVTIGSIGQKLTLIETPSFVNQAVNAVIPDDSRFDSLFVYYLLRHNLHLVKGADTGASSGRENVSKSNFSGLEVMAPADKDQQARIAGILGGYDDLIENNRRRIALLEESARLLYREWFVHLRFPGAGPLCSSTGLPAGWRRAPLEEALFLQRGFDLPNISRVPDGVPIYASSGVAGFHNSAKADGPGVVTGRSGTLGVVHYVDQNYWPLNTSLWVKEFRAVTPAFAYFLLAEMDLAQLNSGSTVPTLDRKVAHAQLVTIPSVDAVAEFEERVSLVLKKIKALEKLNVTATEARDSLLPKLMSGEIAV